MNKSIDFYRLNIFSDECHFIDPNLQRTINVDIRFVLLIMDKYAGARNLIEELTLVK
jgi:hypothetical protein